MIANIASNEIGNVNGVIYIEVPLGGDSPNEFSMRNSVIRENILKSNTGSAGGVVEVTMLGSLEDIEFHNVSVHNNYVTSGGLTAKGALALQNAIGRINHLRFTDCSIHGNFVETNAWQEEREFLFLLQRSE